MDGCLKVSFGWELSRIRARRNWPQVDLIVRRYSGVMTDAAIDYGRYGKLLGLSLLCFLGAIVLGLIGMHAGVGALDEMYRADPEITHHGEGAGLAAAIVTVYGVILGVAAALRCGGHWAEYAPSMGSEPGHRRRADGVPADDLCRRIPERGAIQRAGGPLRQRLHPGQHFRSAAANWSDHCCVAGALCR